MLSNSIDPPIIQPNDRDGTSNPGLQSAARRNVFVPIVDSLPLPTILQLMGTSSELRAETQACLRIAYHSFLKQFHLSPDGFRNVMRKHGAIAFGDDALKFILRDWDETCVAQRLSILVPATEAEHDFATILQSAGYEKDHRIRGDMGPVPFGLLWIMVWSRPNGNGAPPTRIRLFVTYGGAHNIEPLLHMPTTAHLSYITADSIHVPLPHLTLAREAIIIAREFTEDTDNALSVDRLRPWSRDEAIHLQTNLKFNIRGSFDWPQRACGSACGIAMQSLKSSRVLRVTFDDEGTTASQWYSSGDGFQGQDAHFQLRGRCYNVHCPNYNAFTCAHRIVVLNAPLTSSLRF